MPEFTQTRRSTNADPIADAMESGVIQRKERSGAMSPEDVARAADHHLGGGGGGSAGALPSGGGQALDSGVKSGVEQATGQELGDVRVHTGSASQDAAAGMGARAFTVNNDIHLGAGESASDSTLMTHEATHTLHQAGGGGAAQAKRVSEPGDALEQEADAVAEAVASGGTAPVSVGAASGVVQRDAASDAVSAFGADGTEDAVRALYASLASMSWRRLTTAIEAIMAGEAGQKFLEGVPNHAEPEIATKIAVITKAPALRPSLRTGTYGWVSGATTANAVVEAIAECDEAGFMDVLTQLHNEGKLDTVAARTNQANHDAILAARIETLGNADAHKDVLKAIFDASPDARLNTLTACMAKYFDMTVAQFTLNNRTGDDWNAAGMRASWDALETLPDRDVALIDLFGRYEGSEGEIEGLGGRHSGTGDDVVGMSYDDDERLDRTRIQGSAQARRGDPLYGKNQFDATVRHEVGHIVENQVGYDALKGQDAFGGWQEYNSWNAVAMDMITRSGDAIRGMLAGKNGLTDYMGQPIADPRAHFVSLVENWLENQDGAMDLSIDIDYWDQLTRDEQQLIRRDPLIDAIEKGAGRSYRLADGGRAMQGRIFQKDGSVWYSYASAARDRRVSSYQFKAPGEWFAEAYAAYYEPGGERGSTLARRDQATKDWFDQNVHGR